MYTSTILRRVYTSIVRAVLVCMRIFILMFLLVTTPSGDVKLILSAPCQDYL